MEAVDYRALVQAAGDAVVMSDAEGVITVWNPAAERIFGFAEAEAMGKSLDIIVPDRHRKRHWDAWAKTMETGVTRYGHELLRVPALHKDGRTLSVAFSIGLLFDAGQAVTGVLAIMRDETARWNEERTLKRRVAELENSVQVTPLP
jgi:PAS domain S-box-containing protein